MYPRHTLYLAYRHYLVLVVCAGLGVLFAAHSTISAAAIYKCVDVAGNTTYTGTPCASEESTGRISKSASVLPVLDCRVARKFAADTAQRMQTGESSGDLFDHYGGLDSTSPFVKNLVSYIYSFKGNNSISEERIIQLSAERCQVGSFGPVGRRCDNFPASFVDSQGGCDQVRGILDGYDSVAHYSLPAIGEAKPETKPEAPRQYATPAGSSQRSAATQAVTSSSDLRANCQQRLARSIERTVSEMKNAQDAKSQERLTKRHRQLRSQLTRC